MRALEHEFQPAVIVHWHTSKIISMAEIVAKQRELDATVFNNRSRIIHGVVVLVGQPSSVPGQQMRLRAYLHFRDLNRRFTSDHTISGQFKAGNRQLGVLLYPDGPEGAFMDRNIRFSNEAVTRTAINQALATFFAEDHQ